MAQTAYSQGLLTPALKRVIEDEQQAVVAMIDARRWDEAHARREVSVLFMSHLRLLGFVYVLWSSMI